MLGLLLRNRGWGGVITRRQGGGGVCATRGRCCCLSVCVGSREGRCVLTTG